MLPKEKIVELMDTLSEHKLTVDVLVPVLEKMGLKGVKYTGGTDEQGIDVEYYELTAPERHRSYVGIQVKKGDLTYSAHGTKDSVKAVKNQAEEAFEKEIHDIGGKRIAYISRYVVAITGEINEPARKYIGKARARGSDRRIDYWDGDRIAEYIQKHWMPEFEDYFSEQLSETVANNDDVEEHVVDAEYIETQFDELVEKARAVLRTVDTSQREIIESILYHQPESRFGGGQTSIADVLLAVGTTMEMIEDDLRHLQRLDYVYLDEDGGIYLNKHAESLRELLRKIEQELEDAEEDETPAEEILKEILGS